MDGPPLDCLIACIGFCSGRPPTATVRTLWAWVSMDTKRAQAETHCPSVRMVMLAGGNGGEIGAERVAEGGEAPLRGVGIRAVTGRGGGVRAVELGEGGPGGGVGFADAREGPGGVGVGVGVPELGAEKSQLGMGAGLEVEGEGGAGEEGEVEGGEVGELAAAVALDVGEEVGAIGGLGGGEEGDPGVVVVKWWTSRFLPCLSAL